MRKEAGLFFANKEAESDFLKYWKLSSLVFWKWVSFREKYKSSREREREREKKKRDSE